MSLEAMRNAIKATLEGVDGIGIVHDYERYATDLPAMRQQYALNGKLNGWSITRERTTAAWQTMVPVQTLRRHRFILRGYYGLEDAAASEKTFQALVEAVEAAFRADGTTLNGTARYAGPLQVAVVEPRMFGNVLVHYAELVIEAEEEVS